MRLVAKERDWGTGVMQSHFLVPVIMRAMSYIFKQLKFVNKAFGKVSDIHLRLISAMFMLRSNTTPSNT